jgi:hypothetical protein
MPRMAPHDPPPVTSSIAGTQVRLDPRTNSVCSSGPARLLQQGRRGTTALTGNGLRTAETGTLDQVPPPTARHIAVGIRWPPASATRASCRQGRARCCGPVPFVSVVHRSSFRPQASANPGHVERLGQEADPGVGPPRGSKTCGASRSDVQPAAAVLSVGARLRVPEGMDPHPAWVGPPRRSGPSVRGAASLPDDGLLLRRRPTNELIAAPRRVSRGPDDAKPSAC